MRTCRVTPAEIDKKWLVVDAAGQTVGRLATEIARLLRGKHKPNFVPHLDCGDNVIVINAEQVKLTARKWQNKVYYHHTGYIGGIKGITASDLLKKHPEQILNNAVKGMLPKNKLSNSVMKNLRIYAGSQHGHQGQKPVPAPARTISL